MFTCKKGKEFTVLLIYVDDILITGNDPIAITVLKQFLHNHFRIKDLGDLKCFLGMEVSRSKKGIFISQRKYTLEILDILEPNLWIFPWSKIQNSRMKENC